MSQSLSEIQRTEIFYWLGRGYFTCTHKMAEGCLAAGLPIELGKYSTKRFIPGWLYIMLIMLNQPLQREGAYSEEFLKTAFELLEDAEKQKVMLLELAITASVPMDWISDALKAYR